MRALVITIAVASLLWSGYWLYGASTASNAVRDWLAQRERDGWVARAEDVATGGFPNRLDTTITVPELRPHAGVSWSAPFVQILRLSYKPEHAILIFPDRQTITLASTEIAITSDRFRASTVFDRGTLDRANLAAEGVVFAAQEFGPVTVANMLAAIRTSPARSVTHDLAIELKDISLPSIPDIPSPMVQSVIFDATARLDTPLSLTPLVKRQPELNELDLRRFQISADGFDLLASGTLTRTNDGSLSGTLDLIIEDWRTALAAVAGYGLIAPDLLEQLGSELDRLAGDAEALSLPLDIRRGAIFLNALRLN